MTAEKVIASALQGLERDQPVTTRRIPGMNLLYAPVEVVANLVPRRARLIAFERLTRWYFKQDESASSGRSSPR